MKKATLFLSLLILLIWTGACKKAEPPDPPIKEPTAAISESEKSEARKAIRELIEKNEFTAALTSIDEAIEKYGLKEFCSMKAYVLHKTDQSEPALALIDQAIAAQTSTPKELNSIKHEILSDLGRYDEALNLIKKQDEESERKSPWTCLTIAEDYLKLNRPQDALTALEMAVERGLIQKSALLEQEAFKPLLETDGFKALLKNIDVKIGIGAPAKAFSLQNLKGEAITLEALKGQVVLIDFWATWCPPCREEIPNLKAYYAELKEKGFEIVGISLDKERGALDQYIADHQIAWPITFSGKVWEDETVALYSVNSIPSTWLIDKKGQLRHFGLQGEELKAAILSLLQEK